MASLGIIVIFGTCWAAIWGWQKLRDSPSRAGRAAAKTADTLHALWVRLAGAALTLLGLFGLWSILTNGFEWWRLASLLLVAWGVRLLFFYR